MPLVKVHVPEGMVTLSADQSADHYVYLSLVTGSQTRLKGVMHVMRHKAGRAIVDETVNPDAAAVRDILSLIPSAVVLRGNPLLIEISENDRIMLALMAERQ